MKALYRKEITVLFGNFSGFIWAALFLLLSGLFLFLFEGRFNIFDAGYASLDAFFELAPWFLSLIIPALCMGIVADEKSKNTFEIIMTKPISVVQFLGAKISVIFTWIFLVLLVSVIFLFSIVQLANPEIGIDWGTLAMQYLGLFLLSSCFSIFSILASSFTSNTIIALALGVFFNFIFFFGFSGIASYNLLGSYDIWVQKIGMQHHYTSFLKGIFDSRSFFYFVLVAVLGFNIAYAKIQQKK